MKTLKPNQDRKNSLLMLMGIVVATFSMIYGCSNNKSKEEGKAPEVVAVDVVEEIWIIDEHEYNDIPLTSLAEDPSEKESSVVPAESPEKEAQSAAEEVEIEAEEELLEEAYTIAAIDALEEDLIEQEYEALESTIAVTEIAIPLEETQTLVSYAKKDKNDAAIQVVTNLQTGEVEQITFVDKKHRDVYDVQAGLTGKEVKKLRKEMKHMVKKGQVFLYDDQSNIMYLMDAQNMVGDEITAADVETMEVQSIVWKDKKHHKKNK